MSRALLSEACECGESWRCLHSPVLGTATQGVCFRRVLGRLVLIRLVAEGAAKRGLLKMGISRGNRRKAQEMV